MEEVLSSIVNLYMNRDEGGGREGEVFSPGDYVYLSAYRPPISSHCSSIYCSLVVFRQRIECMGWGGGVWLINKSVLGIH